MDKSGGSKFLKDGFTDISGCFDYYYSVSTEVPEQARKVGILWIKRGMEVYSRSFASDLC